jgi:hypothetical protein
MRRRAEADFCAEYSCTVPITAFSSSTATMKMALGNWPTASATTAATSRM